MMLICLVIIPVAFFCAYLISDALVCLVDKNCGSSIFSSWNSLDMTSYDEDGKSFKIARIRELVEADDFVFGMIFELIVDEVCADETRAARHND